MMELYLSLSAYGGVSTQQALTLFAQAGIQQVELAIGVIPDANAAIAIPHFQEQGMQFRAHHAFVWQAKHSPFNLARRVDWEHLLRMLDWLTEQNITAYSVHPGSYRAEGDRSQAWQQFLSNIERLSQLCQQREIELAVETMYPTLEDTGNQYFLGDLASIQAFQKKQPHLKWVLDLSHLNIGAENTLEARLQIIDCIRDRLLEIHVSDNDGRRDRHSHISNTTWWLPYRDRLPRTVPFVLETRLNRCSAAVLRSEYQRVRSLLSEI